MKQIIVKKTVRASVLVAMAATMVIGTSAMPAFAASDKQLAKASTLQESDLSGTGWSSSPHTEHKDSTQPSCKATNAANKAAKKFGAHAPDFDNSDGASVTNTVYVFPNVKQARAYLATFKLPGALECFQKGLDDSVASSQGATAAGADLNVKGGPADDGVGFQGTLGNIPTGATPPTVDLYVQAVAFRVGRGVTGITTSNPSEAYPSTVDLATTAIARLKKNLK